jgi:hypothetical protein
VAANFCVAWRRIPGKERLGTHDHARNAVATLRRLLVDECLLDDTRQSRVSKSLDSRDRALAHD